MGVRDAPAPPTLLAEYQARFSETELSVGGGRWRWRETHGRGPALMLLPGAQGTGDMFYRTALALGDDFRVITATPPAWADCERVAASLPVLLDALSLATTHLLGSSLSGVVVQWFAQAHPRRIDTLFLANTFCDATRHQINMPTPEQIEHTQADALLERMLGNMLAAPESEVAHAELREAARALMGPQQSAETLKARLLALRLARPAPRVPLGDDRIVLIDDDADPVITPDMRTSLRKRYADCEHHAIAGGGHYPAILRPQAYESILRARLERAG